MRSTQLGASGLQVSAMGIGAMHLSLAGRPPREQALAVLHRALELGVTFIDTADAYCVDEGDKHHNETLVHEALATWTGDSSGVVIATKGGLMRPGGAWTTNGDPAHLRRTIRESHAALGSERAITLWQHHDPDPDVALERSLEPVREAVREGLIRFVGVSNYSVEQIERAREMLEVISVQNQYSPWHREPERDGVLAYCEREGLTFLPWSPLGGSSRAKRLEDFPDLLRLARERQISPQRLVLAWHMAKAPCVLPIPGVSRTESLEDCLGALDVQLSDEEVRRIDRTASRA